jgi:hypothetical protein
MLRPLMVAFLALFATQATAASKLYISEYAAVGVAQGTVAQVAAEPILANQLVDFSGGVASSAAFNAATSYVRVVCDTQCAVLFGTAPTALTSSKLLPALLPEYFAVPKGSAYKISVIASP